VDLRQRVAGHDVPANDSSANKLLGAGPLSFFPNRFGKRFLFGCSLGKVDDDALVASSHTPLHASLR